MKELNKLYNPKEFEDRLYSVWMDNECFKANADKTLDPYTIVMPPPNVTGQLHMGHALDATLQDILIRYKRMQGKSVLWLPGTDHAAIATEARVVEMLRSRGIDKAELGREGFLKYAWEWKEKYGGKIQQQLKKMGSSCDWSRERFTMDEGCSNAVNEVFIRLYNKGLIYKGERIVNWCPHCCTSISDAEVEHEEQQGFFWHIKYPLADKSGFVEIATTRPETLLGDTAVAVNPKDERYKDIVGKSVILPIVNREIPVVADEYVDMDFGTGVVKITPAHDPNDFEVGVRHNLPVINVMDEHAVINENGGKYCGQERYEARKNIVDELELLGLLVKIEPHVHNVGTCYRCSTTVEPWVSKQWFVKMKPLAEPAIECVKNGDTRFVPERFEKLYFHWMENIRDWCISRQLWWGHRIPAFYCDDCGEISVTKEASAVCPKCNKPMRRDEDTLDTWFSSALWPFSTLGWPDDTEDYRCFYPTSTLVTGYDIITFWVSRMIFSGLEYTGKAPFETVLIHGLVRDAQGRKMSKSLGNGIDPLEIIDSYGADALRLTLVTGNSPGNDMRFVDEKIIASRNFANKLWNASRYVLMNLPDDFSDEGFPEELKLEDKWIIGKFNSVCAEVSENLDKYELGIAVSKIYDFIWDYYCDWYIELSKPRIFAGGEDKNNVQRVLVGILKGMLKLLHPFMPFITEELWQTITDGKSFIMLEVFPKYDASLAFESESAAFEKIVSAIRAVRNLRTSMNVPSSVKAELFIETEDIELFKSCSLYFEKLAGSSGVKVAEKYSMEKTAAAVTENARIFIPLSELIDIDKEIERLKKESDKALKDIEIISKKLSNEGFLAKAPEQLVASEREKLMKAEERLNKIEKSIAELSD